MDILITGGCGFIGSNFTRYILNNHTKWKVVNLDKLNYAGNPLNLKEFEDTSRYRFVKGDVANRGLVEKVFFEEEFDAVINFAAESHVDRSVMDASPFVETNIKGTQTLMDAARKSEINRFIQISTDEVYGSLGETGEFTENSPISPNSPYAASKASADILCRSYHITHDFPVIITRSSNNYGPYQFPEKLIPLMIRNALSGEELPVYGEGKEVRDWLYVEDNVRAIEKVLRKGKPGEVYNIGGRAERENIEVVKKIRETLKNHPNTPELSPEIRFIEDPRGAAHDFRYALDCSKIENSLGWKPTIDFERGLSKTIDWYINNLEWVEKVISSEYQDYYDEVYD